MTAIVYKSKMYQGDTSPLWHLAVPFVNDEGVVYGDSELSEYSCLLVFTDSDGVQHTREITEKNASNNVFLAQITPSESQMMSLGKNKIVFQIDSTNEAKTYRSEVHIDLTVKEQRYVNPTP